MSKTKEGIEVRVGQVWEQVYDKDAGRFTVALFKGPDAVIMEPDPWEDKFLLVAISMMHDHGHSWSWKLIQDTP